MAVGGRGPWVTAAGAAAGATAAVLLARLAWRKLGPQYDCLVVGGGVMGSCTAYALAKKGYKVALLEQFAFLHRKGSSHGESRIIRKTYPEDYHVEMMHVAYDLWEEAQAEAGLRVYTHTGGLDVAHKDAPAIQSLIAGCIKHGAPIEVLDPVEAAARLPQLHLPEDFIAVVNPDSGVLNASRSTGMFQDLARRRGAILKDNVKVERIEERRNGLLVRLLSGRRDSVVLHTDQGEFTAAKCVVTAGAWAGKVLEQYLGQPLKLQPLHTTVAYWRCPKPELFQAARPFPVFIHYGESLELYGTPILEYPGCVKFSLHGGPPCDPDERSCIPRVQDLEGEATELMRRFLPDVDWSKPVMAESCMYTNTPDEHFLLDHASEHVVVGAGFSGHGFKMAPLVGDVLADLAFGRAPRVDLSPFRLSRLLAAA